ncbi:latrophilin Cirl-like [Sarcoptes scabiei]|nr:latrophilin Cirl-like [Sarcoptes scabiei]
MFPLYFHLNIKIRCSIFLVVCSVKQLSLQNEPLSNLYVCSLTRDCIITPCGASMRPSAIVELSGRDLR